MGALTLTRHARERMQERRIPADAVEAALAFGREIHTRGMTAYAIGRKEMRMAEDAGISLVQLEGIQVLCRRDGEILTVYRNRNFRGLRRAGRNRPYRYRRTRTTSRHAAFE